MSAARSIPERARRTVVVQFDQDPLLTAFGMTDRLNCHSEQSEESFLMPTLNARLN
jgi:hypothetical protein